MSGWGDPGADPGHPATRGVNLPSFVFTAGARFFAYERNIHSCPCNPPWPSQKETFSNPGLSGRSIFGSGSLTFLRISPPPRMFALPCPRTLDLSPAIRAPRSLRFPQVAPRRSGRGLVRHQICMTGIQQEAVLKATAVRSPLRR